MFNEKRVYTVVINKNIVNVASDLRDWIIDTIRREFKKEYVDMENESRIRISFVDTNDQIGKITQRYGSYVTVM